METNLLKGRLKSWNDDKGFGFIEPENGKKETFIHISAFKRMIRRPVVGDVINYQIHIDNDGKERAVNAKIAGVAEARPRMQRKNIKTHNSNNWLSKSFTVVLFVLLGFAFYNKVIGKSPSSENFVLSESVSLGKENSTNFICTGKVYCSEMTSCEEAKFYQNHCPNTKMDGDGDGIPCESQWCSW